MLSTLLTRLRWFALSTLMFSAIGTVAPAQSGERLPDTGSLQAMEDRSAAMVAGIDRYLLRALEASGEQRAAHWQRDVSSAAAYDKSIAGNRERFRTMIGAVDERVAFDGLEFAGTTGRSALVAETDSYRVYAVRWPVLRRVHGEGLLLEPKQAPSISVIAIPDADQTPEMIAGLAEGVPAAQQFARRLAEQGCRVIVPVLIDRDDEWSGSEQTGIYTNQPHREWVYRMAFELGQHVIGYEVQKVLALVDWLEKSASSEGAKIGVAGYGEGGLLAFYSAALDTRIDAALVSGYFNRREAVWEEPIYRNVFGLLREFGDAELAATIAPRPLLIEYSEVAEITGPPKGRKGRRGGAAPGVITTPGVLEVEQEFLRARDLLPEKWKERIQLLHGNEGIPIGPGSDQALRQLLAALGHSGDLAGVQAAPGNLRGDFDPKARQHRQLRELVDFTQRVLRLCEYTRQDRFWKKHKPEDPGRWEQEMDAEQEVFWNEVIGRLPDAALPANPRSRKLKETEHWTAYEVVLDVWPDVFSWGYLLLPKDLKPGEKRPVVVCQHGLEGLPEQVIEEDESVRAWRAYKAFAARLAERGFITFAPHNPYRGRDAFRTLQRKLNPLGKTLFSVIVEQHDVILQWLGEQPFVDPERIGFYGLSYGGKSAMRIPALLEGYCLSICSADFNEWVKKNATIDARYSYMFTGEYEIFEWDLGHTFNYAEMAALIAPRPFMVERGHDDGVAPDEWVAYEYAKIRRFYNKLGIGNRTEIEFFDGPHTINAQGTFRFLHKHLDWPEPAE